MFLINCNIYLGDDMTWFKKGKELVKKLLHRHKYTELYVYPPRSEYGELHYDFLIKCKCGHKRLAKMPRSIEIYYHVNYEKPKATHKLVAIK